MVSFVICRTFIFFTQCVKQNIYFTFLELLFLSTKFEDPTLGLVLIWRLFRITICVQMLIMINFLLILCISDSLVILLNKHLNKSRCMWAYAWTRRAVYVIWYNLWKLRKRLWTGNVHHVSFHSYIYLMALTFSFTLDESRSYTMCYFCAMMEGLTLYTGLWMSGSDVTLAINSVMTYVLVSDTW